MTKKITAIVFGVGLLGASAAHATSNNPHFWGTLGIGMANNSVTLSENNNSNVFSPDPVFNKGNLAKLSAAGLARIGFGMNFYKCFHAGIFFDLIGDSFNSTDFFSMGTGTTLNSATTRAKSDFLTYGGGLRLGYRIMEKTLLYASFAAVSRRYKMTFTSDTASAPEVEFTSSSKASTAFVPGIGLEYYITPCIAIGMQGTTEIHSSKTYESDGLTQATGLGSWMKIKPANLTGLLTFTYKYNL